MGLGHLFLIAPDCRTAAAGAVRSFRRRSAPRSPRRLDSSRTQRAVPSRPGATLDLGDNTPPEQVGASLADYAGSWEGYAEAYDFKDGSDRVRLRIDANGNGRLEVGSSPAVTLPGKDDPEPIAVAAQYALPGYGYEMTGAVIENHRIRLAIPIRQPAEQWCAQFEPVLQDPAPLPGDPYYACHDFQHDTAQEELCVYGGLPSGCGVKGCGLVCACTETSCAAPPNAGTGHQLDGALEQEGDRLVGTLHLYNQRLTLRLARPVMMLRDMRAAQRGVSAFLARPAK